MIIKIDKQSQMQSIRVLNLLTTKVCDHLNKIWIKKIVIDSKYFRDNIQKLAMKELLKILQILIMMKNLNRTIMIMKMEAISNYKNKKYLHLL